MKYYSTLVFIPIALALCGALNLAMAEGVARDEVPGIKAGLAAAKISLSQAIASAEAYVPGQAAGAELGEEPGNTVYDIEILNGDKLMDVKVDSRDGKVISSRVDPEDRNGNDAGCDD